MKKIYILSLLVVSTLSFGQVFTSTYDFAGIPTSATNGTTDPTTPPIVAGLVFANFITVNPGAPTTFTGSSAGGRFAYPNQPTGATNADNATFTGVIDTGIYHQVTVTPNAGTTYNLSGLIFGMRRSGTGPRNYSVRSSVDGYGANLPATIAPANTNLSVIASNTFFWTLDATATSADQLGSTITLGSTFVGLTTPVTFRFYGWNSEASAGTFSLDNVAISGNVTTLSLQKNTISGLSIYPNPVTGKTFNVTSANNGDISVVIYDVIGKQVLNTKVINNTVNVANLNAGIYIVKITEEGKTATRKLVIQ